ncbi:type III PLP-dependent enzyme [Sphingomicrobium sediminis]|uniref:ornithine decarboxylase n=1 Tax=Sphingomicrobium sediminis TaxID=2950949 RepID=A0A9X2EK63_9SPHN|nr:type III PLP-dependent enzyme [Sphingomicrobium sediminis]MCM8556817.1 type III PLP-dependent enzyme [Sphingomicrobium sediminis]
MHEHHSALGLVKARKPILPVTLVRPHAAFRAARFFVEKLPGKSLYAVKANPDPDLLKVLWEAGISHYDVASMGEVRLVAQTLPEATLCFMHPVKATEAIEEAYFVHGVKTFSLDSMAELEKIRRATRGATDLNLLVRLRVSSEHSKLSLATKFGAEPGELPELLMAARQTADALGLCFHVGSQAMSPAAFGDAMERVRAAIVESSVTIDIVDVGGGFPSAYPDLDPPAMESFFQMIHEKFEDLPISYSAELWAEPGRALCAEYSSVLVRVEQRRGNTLYINDGAYGALFDAAHIGWRYPTRLIREEDSEAELVPFRFFGPTCDDMDKMEGPFFLPDDIGPGDYIEIGMLGAYGNAMRTQFNGFTTEEPVRVSDDPMMTLYGPRSEQDEASNVVRL